MLRASLKINQKLNCASSSSLLFVFVFVFVVNLLLDSVHATEFFYPTEGKTYRNTIISLEILVFEQICYLPNRSRLKCFVEIALLPFTWWLLGIMYQKTTNSRAHFWRLNEQFQTSYL